MGFPRQEYWSGLLFPSPGDLTDPGIEPMSPAWAGGFFTAEPPRESDGGGTIPENTISRKAGVGGLRGGSSGCPGQASVLAVVWGWGEEDSGICHKQPSSPAGLSWGGSPGDQGPPRHPTATVSQSFPG